MNDYILRLYRLGIPMHEALRIYEDFKRYYNEDALEEYISDMERDHYVDRIQSKPCWT